MKKRLKVLFILIILILVYLYVANITLIPKSITLLQGEKLKLACLWGVSISKENNNEIETLQASSSLENNQKVTESGRIDANINLFNKISLAKMSVTVIPETKVIPLGNSIGLKLYTEGVLVVGMSEIDGKKPYEKTGIQQGDRIIEINNKKISSTDELVETVNLSKGRELQIKYIKEGSTNEKETKIEPIKTGENEYKLGLWVRDAAAGVGTASFYEPNSRNVCFAWTWNN